jgi:hypothetical protein
LTYVWCKDFPTTAADEPNGVTKALAVEEATLVLELGMAGAKAVTVDAAATAATAAVKKRMVVFLWCRFEEWNAEIMSSSGRQKQLCCCLILACCWWSTFSVVVLCLVVCTSARRVVLERCDGKRMLKIAPQKSFYGQQCK